MSDREKYIEVLSKAIKTIKELNEDIPIKINLEFAEDILELLKEKEARILDWDELEDWGNAVWFEDDYELECYIALIANVGTYDAKFTNVEPGKFHKLDFLRQFYKKEWRCWSAKPTDEQRQEVEWE